MAERSGGSVVIRLAVRDGEVVRRALQDVGDEGKRALKALDDAARAPTQGALALSSAVQDVRTSIEGMGTASGALGPVTTLLRGLGPAGLAAAIGVTAGAAAVALGVGKAREALDDFGATVDAANSAGLSTDVYQAIAASALVAGVNVEEVNGALSKFSVAAGQAAAGQGELYEKLALYNPAAAEAIENATTQEERVRILAKALAEAANAEERNAIAVAAFGRSGVQLGRAFAEAGGSLDNMVASAKELGLIVPRETLARAEELGDKLDLASKIIDVQLKQAALDLIPLIADLAEKAASFARYMGQGYRLFRDGTPNVAAQAARTPGPDDAVAQATEALAVAQSRLRGAEDAGNAVVAANLRKVVAEQQAELERLQEAQRERNRGLGLNRGGTGAPEAETGPTIPVPRPAPEPTAEEENKADAARDRRLKDAERVERAAAQARAELGDVSGLVAIKKRELDELVSRGALSTEQATAALEKYRQEQVAAASSDADREAALRKAQGIEREAAEVRADLGDISGLVAIKQRELNELVEKGAISQDTATAALVKYRDELDKTNTSRMARSSAFSGLARLSAEGADLRGLYDEGATDLVKGLTDDLMKLDKTGGSVAATLKSMGNTIFEMVQRMIYARYVAKPLADGLMSIGDSIFGGGSAGAAAPATPAAAIAGAIRLAGPGNVTRAPLPAPAVAAATTPSERVAQAFDAGGWLKYSNQGAIRSQPIDPKLANAFSFLQERGIQMEVFSGGQAGIGTGGPRTGSTRHDHGMAADVMFSQNGRRLDWANPQDQPVFEDIVRTARANGVTGFGAGPGYMRPGSMHVGFGSPGVWGAGGRGSNAPDWLRNAYNSPSVGPRAEAPAVDVSKLEASLVSLKTTTDNAATAIPQMTTGATAAAPALGGLGQTATGLGGIFQNIFSGLGQVGSGLGTMVGLNGGWLSNALGSVSGFNPFGFEKGGIMSELGPMVLQRYRDGGVAHGPMLSHFAEGATPEAYVPLADGRSIPVRIAQERSAAEAMRFTVADAGGTTTREVAAPISVQVINNTPARVETREEDDGRGRRRPVIQIDEATAGAARSGPKTRNAMRDMFNARSKVDRR